jgi:hypothetical protein
MDAQTQDFYIHGIYFREQADISRFLAYAKWLKRVGSKQFGKHALNYALFEILAEYKRRGLSAITVGENLCLGG